MSAPTEFPAREAPMKLAICFTNFGPYHLARLRALARRLQADGGRLIAYETAGTEAKYPWRRDRGDEPFEWVALAPGAVLEELSAASCRRAMERALGADQPDAVAIVGYVRPESLASLRWALRHGRPTVLMSESQASDRPRAWWKEAVKSRRVRRFDAALVGGPRHRDYLVELGMPPERIVLGYDAVDHRAHAERASRLRLGPRPGILPVRPYFLAVSRFVVEKDLPTLVRAYGRYRAAAPAGEAWDLALCGDGPSRARIDAVIGECGVGPFVHRPGFLQEAELAPWFAWAGAFVLPSRSEPWGLVVNEAAACGLPLIVSDAAGCAGTLVPDPPGTTGWRFGPGNVAELAGLLELAASLPAARRDAIGADAAAVAARWGPERFAEGTVEALELARSAWSRRRTRFRATRRVGR
jgi:glycosyltransferase involved in cell wall biosynthesis